MSEIIILMIGLAAVILVISAALDIRNAAVYRNRTIIINAILDYRLKCVDLDISPRVDYSDMELYRETFNRFWDFGYARILSPRKFRIIKPYIRK